MRMHVAAVSLSSVVLTATACSSSGKPPALTPSGGQAAYALHYDEELAATTKSIADAQAREKTLSSGFGAHIDALKKPDWHKVEVVIDDSDEAGKSADFADAESGAVAIKTFWESEKSEVGARVYGAAQQKLTEAGCNGDVAGPITYALGEAINKQLQKRLRSRNEAFVVIERYRIALGPQNAASLEKLADDVAEASYDVHALMVLQRNRLQRLVADKNDVKKTLDRTVQEETDFQAEPGRSDAEKKASAERVNAANKSKADLDNVASEAEAVSKDLDKAIDSATKDYDEALKSLKGKVAEKKKAEPVPAKT